jgi:hypothetical protein
LKLAITLSFAVSGGEIGNVGKFHAVEGMNKLKATRLPFEPPLGVGIDPTWRCRVKAGQG